MTIKTVVVSVLIKKAIALILCLCIVCAGTFIGAAAHDFDTDIIPTIEQSGISASLSITGHAGQKLLDTVKQSGLQKGTKVLDVLLSALEQRQIHYTIKGTYISEIGGLAEFDYGKYSGWMYTVDGRYPTVPMGEYALSGGEQIEIIYVESFVPIGKESIEAAVVSGITAKAYTAKALAQKLTVCLGDTILKEKKDYTVTYENNVKVGTARVIITGCGNYTGSITESFKINLAKPAVKVAAASTTAVKLSWGKVPGAKYYRVYEYFAGAKKYVRLATTTATQAVCKKLGAGSQHAYLVKACFVNKGGVEICSPFTASDCIKAAALCKAPAAKAAASGKTVTLKWNKCAGVAFYKVYAYNAKTKKYTTLIKSTSACSAKLQAQAKGTHYYLVRAFNATGQGSTYSTKNLVKAIVK